MKQACNISIFLITLAFTSCGIADKLNEADDARAFNDSIVGHQTRIVRRILDMSNAYQTNLMIAEQCRKEGLAIAAKGIRKVEGMRTANEEQTMFKNASLNLFRFYKDILAIESKELIQILGKDSVDEFDMGRITAIDESISSREAKLDSVFEKAQEVFAKRYGVMLLKNPLQNEIDSIPG